jgi:hypothetical protein
MRNYTPIPPAAICGCSMSTFIRVERVGGVVVAAAVTGMGIALLPNFIVDEALAAGRLSSARASALATGTKSDLESLLAGIEANIRL